MVSAIAVPASVLLKDVVRIGICNAVGEFANTRKLAARHTRTLCAVEVTRFGRSEPPQFHFGARPKSPESVTSIFQSARCLALAGGLGEILGGSAPQSFLSASGKRLHHHHARGPQSLKDYRKGTRAY
jgi:hypothetical protein